MTLVVACLLALAGAAHGDDAKERARALGSEAGELLREGEHAAALEKLEEAEELYHAPTHLQMMGEALEGLGRLAEAIPAGRCAVGVATTRASSASARPEARS